MNITYNPKDVEYYESVDDLLADDQMLEVDVYVQGFKGKVRIRALTFGQMEAINKRALINGELDRVEFTLATLQEGIVRPRVTASSARKLLDYHGEVVRELSDQIWQLGRITKATFEAYLDAVSK